MKTSYTKVLCLWTLMLLIFATSCQNERGDLPLFEKGSRTLRLSVAMPEDADLRVALEEDTEHGLLRARWQSRDRLTLIFEQDSRLTPPVEQPVGAIGPDGKQATMDVVIPESIDIDEAYTLYAFCGVPGRGVVVVDNEILVDIVPIMANDLEEVSVPVMSKVTVEPASTSGEMAMSFTHLGSIEYVDLKNSSDTNLKVSGCSLSPRNGSSEEWQYLPHDDKQYVYKPISDEVSEITDNDPKTMPTMKEVSIAPSKSHTFVRWHRPNGKTIPEFILAMKTEDKLILSENKKTSKTFAMLPGKAYRVEAEWKNNRLEILGEGVAVAFPHITLTVEPSIGKELRLEINAAEEDQSEVWIDLNDNGTMDDGEKVTSFGEAGEYEVFYPIGAEKITIYGKVFYFSCYDNSQLKALDVTKAPYLVNLSCGSDNLTSLDVTQNKLLKILDCSGSYELETLDVSQNVNLIDLICEDTGLSRLDVTQLTKLEELDCSSNLLTSLDISQNLNLRDLDCAHNKLSKLDVTQLTKLEELDCSNNDLKSLDISQNLNLVSLSCEDCNLSSLDVRKHTRLKELNCSCNKLSDLKISDNITETLDCRSCGLSAETLDDLFNTLPDISETKDKIKKVMVSGNPGAADCHPEIATKKGWKVDVEGKPLTPHIMVLTTRKKVGDEIVLKIDAGSEDRPDVWIDLNGNGTKDEGENVTVFGEYQAYPIASQTITIYGKVSVLICISQKISALDVSKNRALIELACVGNELQSLDVTNNNKLTILDCDSNRLESLDVRSNKSLMRLWCRGNSLESLDVGKNMDLELLACGGNTLTTLDVSKNKDLKLLACGGNTLTTLDVSKNTKLMRLFCNDNKLLSSLKIPSSINNELHCGNCNLSAEALNTLFSTLPDVKALTEVSKEIHVYGNPGTNTCDKAIAENKGWKVHLKPVIVPLPID